MAIQKRHLTKFEQRSATQEKPWVRYLIITLALGFFACFLLLPLIAVFAEGLRKGVHTYFEALIDENTLSALNLTLLAAAIAVPLNLVFGIAAHGRLLNFSFVVNSCSRP